MDYCPHCGEEFEHKGPFCGQCGEKVEDAGGGLDETSGPFESSETQAGDDSVTPDDERVVPKEKAGIVGITIGILSSLGIMAGSLLPLSQSCSGYGIGQEVSCSSFGGLLNDPIVSIVLFTFGLVLFLLVVDDFREIGILGSWEPRKTRVYGAYGGLTIFSFFFALMNNDQLRLGGLFLLLSGLTLLGFSGLVGFWRIAFREKAAAK